MSVPVRPVGPLGRSKLQRGPETHSKQARAACWGPMLERQLRPNPPAAWPLLKTTLLKSATVGPLLLGRNLWPLLVCNFGAPSQTQNGGICMSFSGATLL